MLFLCVYYLILYYILHEALSSELRVTSSLPVSDVETALIEAGMYIYVQHIMYVGHSDVIIIPSNPACACMTMDMMPWALPPGKINNAWLKNSLVYNYCDYCVAISSF